MKIFVIKSLFIFLCILVLFKLTIGSAINKLEEKFDYYTSKKLSNDIKNKLRNEMKTAVDKEVYLDPSDAKLIGQFIKKIEKEINLKE